MSEPRFSTESTLVPTSDSPYRRLQAGPGEAHEVRRDLVPDGTKDVPDVGHRLAGLLHFTDFQLADLASPSRVEYLQRLAGTPTWGGMVPAYRPQEFMLAQAIEAIARSMNAVHASDPQRWNFALTTGDNTDSAQGNELNAFLTAMDGGNVDPAAGTRGFADAPVGLGDLAYYSPEPGHYDVWKQRQGLPEVPGAVAAAAAPFATTGLTMPWLSCFGNHDCLVQGRAAAPTGYNAFLTGERKPVGVDHESEPDGDKLAAYVASPGWVAQGEQHQIEALPERAVISKREYVQRHWDSPGLPTGHGFSEANRSEGTAYYVWDQLPGLRFIILDTTNVAGHVDGCIDAAQFAWLQARLDEVSAGGEQPERAVILASHHGLSTMNNGYGEVEDSDRGHLYLAPEVEELLHSHPNVVAWLSGHTHVNRITPRPGATPESGFWEVSTGSIAEWPVQFRGVEVLLSTDASQVRIRTTMVDSQVPAAPEGTLELADLASLHREIAANDSGSVGGLNAEGTARDRNQDLVVAVTPSLGAALSAAILE